MEVNGDGLTNRTIDKTSSVCFQHCYRYTVYNMARKIPLYVGTRGVCNPLSAGTMISYQSDPDPAPPPGGDAVNNGGEKIWRRISPRKGKTS